MTGSQGLFTLKEAAYLRSLPAVKEVSATRITYSDRFKVECVRRYLKGDSARRIFRDAGLEPSLIGAKRIERCVARWKNTKSIMDEAVRHETSDENAELVGTDGMGEGRSGKGSAFDGYDIAAAAFAAIGAGRSGQGMPDVRDLIIYQQVQQITALQEQVNKLQGKIDSFGRADEAKIPSIVG